MRIIKYILGFLLASSVVYGVTEWKSVDFKDFITVDNIKIDGNTISSEDTDGDISITPDGSGNLILDSQEISDAQWGYLGNLDQAITTSDDVQFGSIGVNGSLDSSSLLDVTSTSKGTRPFPSMTATQRDAISSPATGLIVFNTDTNQLNQYDGSAWGVVAGGGGSADPEEFITDEDNRGFESDTGDWVAAQAKNVEVLNVDTTGNIINFQENHGYAIGSLVRYQNLSGGSDVGGLTTANDYYVVAIPGKAAIQVSSTEGGSPIDLTSDESTDHFFLLQDSSIGIGKGGTQSANITFARTTTDPLVGSGMAVLTKDGNNRQGEFVVLQDVAIPLGYQNKPLKLTMIHTGSANYAAGDIKAYIGDNTNDRVTELFGNNGDIGTGTAVDFEGIYYPGSDAASVNIILKVESTSTSAYTLDLDEVRFKWVPYTKLPGTRRQTVDLTSSGDFTAGEIEFVQVQEMLIASVTTSITFSSSTTAASAVGAAPSWARPDEDKRNVYKIFGGSNTSFIEVKTDGQIRIISSTATTASGTEATISYPLSNSANTTEALAINSDLQFEEKILSSSTGTALGEITDLTVDNLVVGRKYQLGGALQLLAGASSGDINGTIYNNSSGTSNIVGSFALNQGSPTASAKSAIFYLNDFFIAQTDTLRFVVDVASTGSSVVGNGTNEETHIKVQEFPFSQTALIGLNKTAFIKDVKASGTDGGTFTSGAWQTRDLNTLSGETSFVSLSSNQFTLQSGTYDFEGSSPAFSVNRHQAKIRNITDSADINDLIGTVSNALASDYETGRSFVSGQITINKPTTFEFQHRCFSTKLTDGFGVGASSWVSNVFAQLKITKIR